MRRIRQECDERKPFAWRMTAALAMAACLAVMVHTALTVRAERQTVAAARAEHRQIQAELAAVKRSATEAEPVVVLENTNGTRVIMDLDSAVQPASLRTFD
jgi:anti-sigma-K factor RskA